MSRAIEVKGLKEAQDALYSYSNQLGTKVTKSAIHNAGTLFLKQARSFAPVRTGVLRKQIYQRDSKWFNGKKIPMIRTFIDVHKGKKYGINDAYYAKFIEYGWNTHGARRTTANTASKVNRFGRRMFSRSQTILPGKTKGRATLPGRQDVLGRYFMRNAFNVQLLNVIDAFQRNLFAGAEIVKRKVGLH